MATADDADVEIARRHAERMYADNQASRALGITLADVGPGKATARMRVLPTMVNGHGIGHGGYLFLLADTAFAVPTTRRVGDVAQAASSLRDLARPAAGDLLNGPIGPYP